VGVKDGLVAREEDVDAVDVVAAGGDALEQLGDDANSVLGDQPNGIIMIGRPTKWNNND
jgi:hypothetical protein